MSVTMPGMPMPDAPAAGHGMPLMLARTAYGEAADADLDRLAADLVIFLHAFGEHLDLERHEIGSLPPPEARMIRRGQRWLERTAKALFADAAAGSAAPRQCAVRAEEVLALLTLQARDEQHALHDPGTGAEPDRRWNR